MDFRLFLVVHVRERVGQFKAVPPAVGFLSFAGEFFVSEKLVSQDELEHEKQASRSHCLLDCLDFAFCRVSSTATAAGGRDESEPPPSSPPLHACICICF